MPADISRSKYRSLFRRPLLLVFTLVAAAYILVALFTIAVDPLNLFPWGASIRLREDNYSPLRLSYNLSVVAKDSTFDTVLLGSSDTEFFTIADIHKSGTTRKVFNYSYPGSWPADRHLVLGEFLSHSHARRLIVEFGIGYLMPPHIKRAEFPFYLYEGDFFERLRSVSTETMVQSYRLLRNRSAGEISAYDTFLSGRRQDQKIFLGVSQQSRLSEMISSSRAKIAKSSLKSCRHFPAIGESLVPDIRTATSRGIQVDILIPPASLASYYTYNIPDYVASLGDRMAADMLLTRRCLVEALDGQAHVRVFAFDNEDWITADLSKYMDPSHMMDPAASRYIMVEIGKGTHQLTKTNVQAYVDRLHKRILDYGDKVIRQGGTTEYLRAKATMH